MSDSEGDIDDELLALAGAGATEKKRKRTQQNTSSKRRKADVEDGTPSDEDHPDSEQETEAIPYPLEGKFIDEADRENLMDLPEIEREAILWQRQEEMQRFTDKRQLDVLLKQQSGRTSGEEAVSKAAKRQRAMRGATKEKRSKLDELKAKRKAKDERKRTRTNSPKRDRSSSPMDMETSDEEEEDGQITKYDEEEERDRKLFGKTAPEEDTPITLEDLNTCRLTRDQIAKHCMAPWFEDYVKGAWLRYCIGAEGSSNVYRICEVQDIAPNLVKPYKIDGSTMVNQELELKHGQSARRFTMDKISNSPFDQREFERLLRVCDIEKVTLPTKRQLEKKAAQLEKFATQPMTESDISAMLARKQAIQSAKQSPALFTMERSRLQQARTLAMRRQDYAEVKAIDVKLVELNANAPVRESRSEESASDLLAKVNERNRKLNQEQVRKAERAEMERKRRERQLRNGTATPTPLDAAGRLRAKMATPVISRPGTPGTPAFGASTPRSESPAAPTSIGSMSFEASVLQSVEIDLGDF